MLTGTISQIVGPVVDVHFDVTPESREELPQIHSSLEITRDNGRVLVTEVQQHIGEDTVRTVAMDSTDGLRRGMEVRCTGATITMPVGAQIRGRVMNVVGNTIDGMASLDRKGAGAVQRSHAVDGFAHDIHHTAADLCADGHRDGVVGAGHGHSAAQAVGRVHRHGADRVLADVLLNLDDEGPAVLTRHQKGLVDRGEAGLLVVRKIKMDVDHRTDDLGNASGEYCHCMTFYLVFDSTYKYNEFPRALQI